jgi:hypothetical protein
MRFIKCRTSQIKQQKQFVNEFQSRPHSIDIVRFVIFWLDDHQLNESNASDVSSYLCVAIDSLNVCTRIYRCYDANDCLFTKRQLDTNTFLSRRTVLHRSCSSEGWPTTLKNCRQIYSRTVLITIPLFDINRRFFLFVCMNIFHYDNLCFDRRKIFC